MNSALYHGWVSHRRWLPRPHAFRYRMGLLLLDLDEQQALFGLSPLAGRSRFSPLSWRETDFLPQFTQHGTRLIDAARCLAANALGYEPQGPVYLLAQPRNWGLAFNPASFFYCYETDGTLAAVICEVSNTPWKERYHYVLPTHPEGESRHRVPKSFHVSPFLPRELEYRMRFSPPGAQLNIRMQDWQGEQQLFEANLGLQRIELTRQSLHRHLLSFPWMTAKTVLSIYWQALRLLLKRTPIYSHQAADASYRCADLEPKND